MRDGTNNNATIADSGLDQFSVFFCENAEMNEGVTFGCEWTIISCECAYLVELNVVW